MSFIIMRLLTGEQVMATLDAEDHTHLHVSHPLVVKLTPVIEEGHMTERITAHPLCQFSADKYYDIPKVGIMFVKELHRTMIPHYLRIVDTYTEEIQIGHRDDRREEEGLTVDDIKRRVDALEEFFNSGSEEEDEEQVILIEGNETIH